MASLVNGGTYNQDSAVPIVMSLQYGANFLKFPINPEELTKSLESASDTEEIEGLGEVSVPTGERLASLTISSFFWRRLMDFPPSFYVAWLEKWKKSGKPARFVVTRLNYSMIVTCGRFEHTVKAGEEDDVYFELELREYRPYGARLYKKAADKDLLERLQSVKNMAVPPVLVELPRPPRASVGRIEHTNPYTARKGDTLMTVTKRLTGGTALWLDLYERNKDAVAEILKDGGTLEPGTRLEIPESWLGGSDNVYGG